MRWCQSVQTDYVHKKHFIKKALRVRFRNDSTSEPIIVTYERKTAVNCNKPRLIASFITVVGVNAICLFFSFTCSQNIIDWSLNTRLFLKHFKLKLFIWNQSWETSSMLPFRSQTFLYIVIFVDGTFMKIKNKPGIVEWNCKDHSPSKDLFNSKSCIILINRTFVESHKWWYKAMMIFFRIYIWFMLSFKALLIVEITEARTLQGGIR